MLKELIKAKERFIQKYGEYPNAVSLSEAAYKELQIECRSLGMKPAQGYTSKRINGCLIFVDSNQKEQIIFGYESQEKFYKEPF